MVASLVKYETLPASGLRLDHCAVARYGMDMSSRLNFGDSEFEPTDEQLQALSREAFADVAELNRKALARLRAEIEELKAEALARLANSQSTPARPVQRQ